MGESIQAICSFDSCLVTQEKSGSLKVWRTKETEYEEIGCYSFLGGYCKGLLNDNKIVLPREGSSLELVDLKNLERIRTYLPDEDNLGSVMCLEKVTIDSHLLLLAGYETGDVVLYDYDTGKVCCRTKLRECVTSLTFDDAKLRGICGNTSNMLQIFTVDKSFAIALKCEINTVNEGCNVVKLRPDRKIFVSGGSDARIRVYSWKTLRTLVVLAEHKKSISDIQFTPKPVRVHNSKLMLCGGADGTISLWNLYN